MIIREAKLEDITQIQIVRNAVKENTLSDPSLVTDADCAEFMFDRGKGWVCAIEGEIVGFSIVDLKENNVWALFLMPEQEHKGIGTKLHNVMVDWYFTQTLTTLWLGTSPNTRAEMFYKKIGWGVVGMHGSKEIKFEMSYDNWKSIMPTIKSI
jgi:GNAT superfamily N-acetyltransferase